MPVTKVDPEARRDVVERYFRSPPDPRDRWQARLYIGAGLAGLLLAVLLLIFRIPWLGLPLLAVAAAILWSGWSKDEAFRGAYAAAMPKPSDGIIDRVLAHELRGVEQRALARLGLTVEDLELESASWDPVAQLDPGGTDTGRLAGKPWTVLGPVPTASAVVGRDGVWRFSQYEVLIICPTDYHLAIYRCVVDLRVAGYHQEETQEYHYSDVVAVSTKTRHSTDAIPEPFDLRHGDQDFERPVRFSRTLLHEFQLVVSSGDRSKIVVGISDEKNPDHIAKLRDSGIEQVVQAVRRMLRDKKAGKV